MAAVEGAKARSVGGYSDCMDLFWLWLRQTAVAGQCVRGKKRLKVQLAAVMQVDVERYI